MAAYFTSSNDAAYLDATTRARSDIALLRTDAEAMVISHYRTQVRDTRFTATEYAGYRNVTGGLENLTDNYGDDEVRLRWYHEDAAQVGSSAAELRFLDAMRREIAAVIKHLAARRPDGGAEERVIKSETRGRRSVTYADEAVTGGGLLPEGFGSYLRPFDLSEEVWAF